MGTQFEDPATSGAEGFYSVSLHRSITIDDDEQKKLIKDGNDQVLKNIEARKKKGDYSRSQTSRNMKEPSLNMSSVDWSGFPGAAHTSHPSSGERKSERRSSLQLTRGAEKGIQRRIISGQGLDSSRETSRSLSPTMSPAGKNKFRSRRRITKVAVGLSGSNDSDDAMDKKSKDVPITASGPKARAERRASGSQIQRSSQRSSVPLSGILSTHSKNRTRRPQTAAQRQSLSPSAGLRAKHHSTSPTGRLRRTVAAAASSTTLEVGKSATNRQRSLRSCSRGKRKKELKHPTDVEEGPLFQKASSFRW